MTLLFGPVIVSLFVLLIGLFFIFMMWLDNEHDIGMITSLLVILIVFMLLFLSVTSMENPDYQVTCGETTYTNAQLAFEGNYLKIVVDDVAAYEDGPCNWSLE